jgi:Fic family protein
MTNTVHSTPQEIDLARNKWIETDLFLRQAALNKEPITKEFLCELNRKVNLGGKNPGELRSKDDEVTGGDATLYNTYLYGEFINESIDEFISWLDRQFSLCDKREADPIELAASAYQRLVSLHPFADANGRTTRALMDYILQRYDLPPAALGQNVKVAIFPLISEKINFLPRKALTPNDAVKLIINGVRKSYEILSQR